MYIFYYRGIRSVHVTFDGNTFVVKVIDGRGFHTVYLGISINYSRVEISAPYKCIVVS